MSIRIENIQVDNLNLGNDLVLESNTADIKMAQVGSIYKNANGFIHAAGVSGVYYYDIATNTIRSASQQQFTSDYYSGQAIPTNFSYMKIR